MREFRSSAPKTVEPQAGGPYAWAVGPDRRGRLERACDWAEENARRAAPMMVHLLIAIWLLGAPISVLVRYGLQSDRGATIVLWIIYAMSIACVAPLAAAVVIMPVLLVLMALLALWRALVALLNR